MKYKVPLYKLENDEEMYLGRILVNKTSLGAYELITGRKIHISSGMINLSQYYDKTGLFHLYVKETDLNRHNLIFTELSKQVKIPANKIYDLKIYSREHQQILKYIKKIK